jgi:hypothetical protein
LLIEATVGCFLSLARVAFLGSLIVIDDVCKGSKRVKVMDKLENLTAGISFY